MMNIFFEFIKSYGTQLSVLGAAVTFAFAYWKFLVERQATLFWKEFEVYHKLIKELVGPPSENGALYVDRQAAIIFEIKNFKRYFPYSLRMLEGLKTNWHARAGVHQRVLTEMELTIEHIKQSLLPFIPADRILRPQTSNVSRHANIHTH